MSDPVWFPESRPIPEELEDDYEAVTYREPTFFPPLAERLNDPRMVARLLEIAAGGLGDVASMVKARIDNNEA